MKQIFFVLVLGAFSTVGMQAQNNKKEIYISEQRVDMTGNERVRVSFRAAIGTRAATNTRTLVFVPVLTDGTYKWALPAIVVQGKKAAITEARKDWAAGTEALKPALEENAILAGNGKSLRYEAQIDWQPWMNGADLVAEVLTMGCCSYSQVDKVLLYGNSRLPQPAVAQAPVAQAPVVAPATPATPATPEPAQGTGEEDYRGLTTGQRLARTAPFIQLSRGLERVVPGRLIDEEREKALSIYFRQGSREIDRGYIDNAEALDGLIKRIRTLEESTDSRITTILIGGFASPEGSFALNDRLAFDRAVAAKSYILEHTQVSDRIIHLYNGSEDWSGLRRLVERSQMGSKGRILDIIDNVPIWDPARGIGREGELMRLEGGGPYKFMYRNFFPLLRNTAYIKIYFENK